MENESPIKAMHMLTDDEVKQLITIAAEAGAKKALADIGLHDEEAGKDVSELRDLLEAWRSARKTAWNTAVKVVTTGFLALIAGAVWMNWGGHK